MRNDVINFKKQLVALDISKMQKLSKKLAIAPIIIGAIAILIIYKHFAIGNLLVNSLVIVLGIFVLTALHELLHAVGFLIAGSRPKDIKFGVIPKQLMVYCSTRVPMTVAKYKFALVLPLIFVGIIPWIISILINNIFLVLLFSAMISGAGGDIVMFKSLMHRDNLQLVLDHPSSPAYYLIFEEDKLPNDFVEVTEEEELALKAQLSAPISSAKNKKSFKTWVLVLMFLAIIVGILLAFFY